MRIWLLLLIWFCGHAGAALPDARGGMLELNEALLITQNGSVKAVTLPYQLLDHEIPPGGGLVRFRLNAHIGAGSQQALGIAIPKMSLSGRLWVNGELVGSCGQGPLEHTRCQHQPTYFSVPASLWKAGSNHIDIDLWATDRQPNGLSAMALGEAEFIYQHVYRTQQWLRSDILYGMTWLATLMGVIALSISIKLRDQPVYFWFGATSMMNAISSANYFVVNPAMDTELFVWLMFSTRLMAIPMGLITYITLFRKSVPNVAHWVLAYVMVVPVALWVTDTSRWTTALLSAPFLPMALLVMLRSIAWLKQQFNGLRLATFVILGAMLFAGTQDWLRLTGRASFDGQFLAPYAFTALLFGIGTLLIRDLAMGLIRSREAQAALEKRATERMAFEMTEHIPVGTYTLRHHTQDGTPRFEFVSRRFLMLTGLERSQLQANAQAFDAQIHPDDLAMWLRTTADAHTHMRPCTASMRMQVRGEWRWIKVESSPRQLVDGSVLWEGVLIDETEQVEQQQASERLQLHLQQQRIEESRMEEREQLLRDMHDGFGSQLASVRMMAEKGRIGSDQFPRYLQEISADLHLVVDIMGQPDISMEVAFQDLRHRLERRTPHGFGPTLHWDIELAHLPHQNPRHLLNILRLVQEALHNALRHADARQIWIRAHFDTESQTLTISVCDDGQGMPDVIKTGRGLNNMRHRARETGGELKIENAHPGVCVRLTLRTPNATTD